MGGGDGYTVGGLLGQVPSVYNGSREQTGMQTTNRGNVMQTSHRGNGMHSADVMGYDTTWKSENEYNDGSNIMTHGSVGLPLFRNQSDEQNMRYNLITYRQPPGRRPFHTGKQTMNTNQPHYQNMHMNLPQYQNMNMNQPRYHNIDDHNSNMVIFKKKFNS